MAATVSYSNITQIFDGQKRIRGVTLSISGTLDASESLSANSCGLNTIDAVVGGILYGTVANVTSKAILMKAVASGGTTAPLNFYLGSGTTAVTAGFTLTTNASTLVIAGEVIVVGQ